MPTINHDVANDDDSFDAEGAFSKLWEPEDDAAKKKKQPSDDDDQADDEKTEGSDEDAATETDDEGDEQSTDEDGEEGDEEEKDGDDDNAANVVVKDDYKVKVKVGDDEQEFTIGSLKRLAGQEAALTQKSQATAVKAKALDTHAATQLAVLDRLLSDAKAKFEPYEKLNFLALAKDPNISAEEITALQEAANSAGSQVRFLSQELGAFHQELQQRRATSLKEQAAETVKVLSDPEKGIKGFTPKLYEDMVSYAKDQGVTDDAIGEIVDPISLRILHKAMLYDAGLKTVKEAADPKAAKAKAKHPKRIVKSFGNSDANRDMKGDKSQLAMKKLQKSGSTDDAASAFLARWSK